MAFAKKVNLIQVANASVEFYKELAKFTNQFPDLPYHATNFFRNLILKKMTKDELGKWGEDFASSFLLQNGYSLVERNVRFKKYEVDIIAEKDNELIVVEVKARNTAEIGEPWRAVTKTKQRQIITVADNYVQKNQIDKNVRFDIISIVHNTYRTNLEHIPGAFDTLR